MNLHYAQKSKASFFSVSESKTFELADIIFVQSSNENIKFLYQNYPIYLVCDTILFVQYGSKTRFNFVSIINGNCRSGLLNLLLAIDYLFWNNFVIWVPI